MAVREFNGLQYNNPVIYGATDSGTNASSIDYNDTGKQGQLATFAVLKKALIDARAEEFFMPLASVENMPKNMGKKLVVRQYVPLLDDRNKNDQGIDAKGAKIGGNGKYGNLWGSSKDIGKITGALPVVGENGGRVNRVGFTRLTREGTFQRFGMFYELSEDALQFDSDTELQSHIARELINGAHKITEAVLQKDLLASAGVVVFPGGATGEDKLGVTAAGGAVKGDTATVVTYDTLMRLDRILTDNRTPKKTKVITGSRFIDTKTLPACRVAYVGSEVVPLLHKMKDYFGNQAFIEVQHYADAGNVLNGEIGAIGHIRFIEVPEMLHWAGVGGLTAANDKNTNDGTSTDGAGYRVSKSAKSNEAQKNRYDVFPILVVGDDSFATIGFQTNGKTVNFNIKTQMPGKPSYEDPYGLTGFSSIQWFYGFLCKRPERIGLIKTIAPI